MNKVQRFTGSYGRGMPRPAHPTPKGQVLVIFAVSLLALLFFIGLALDAGIVYVNYGQLKRAVDAGAVAAANSFKYKAGVTTSTSNAKMEAAVLEVLKLQNMNVDPAALQLTVTTCDMDGNGYKDTTLPASFGPLCPITDPGNLLSASPRKLVYVEARQRAPLYFLSLLGIPSVELTTSSIAEAAAVDLVLVIDTSESMANKSGTIFDNHASDFDPSTCNGYWDAGHTVFTPSSCYPLKNAIDAAQNLVESLYIGYDNISLITYDTVAHDPDVSPKSFHLTSLIGTNKDAVKQRIAEAQVHDDAPFGSPPGGRMWLDWYWNDSILSPAGYTFKTGLINPANMEDRDGNGLDADPGSPCWVGRTPSTDEVNRHWDVTLNIPCDFDDQTDAYDWNGNGVYDDPADSTGGDTWLSTTGNSSEALVSTCTGCAIRAASNELKRNGRPGAVWVIVLLSDGGVNMSDTYESSGQDPDIIPITYPNGFCTQRFWPTLCLDGRTQNKGTYSANPYRLRYCIDKSTTTPPTDPGTCPTGSIWEPRDPASSHYSPFDYALDMVDEAALRASNNPDEPRGNDIAIYTIGLGTSVQSGVPLLRYMAAVGDDGDRITDECISKLTGAILSWNQNCGQYYYAASGADLSPIFDSIASRIYTKITH